MTAPSVIQADVVDITVDTPTSTDLLLVDTNVWVWLTYPPASLPGSAKRYQVDAYPDFIDRAQRTSATLAHMALAFAELASVIEQIAWRIYCETRDRVTRKSFRHLSRQRALVVQSVEAAWEQMNQFSAPTALMIDLTAAQDALDKIQTLPLDGYDAMLLTAASQEGITQILTDDADFAHVPGIQVFTANPRVLDAARGQNKLITR